MARKAQCCNGYASWEWCSGADRGCLALCAGAGGGGRPLRRHPALLDGLDDALREEIERSLSGRETAWRAQRGDQRLFVAVTNLVRLAAAGAGAVLVVDDAHDADDASARLIHYLARSTREDRVLIVIAHRPKLCPALAQVRHSLFGRGNAVTLDMTTLAHDDVAVLARHRVELAARRAVHHRDRRAGRGGRARRRL